MRVPLTTDPPVRPHARCFLLFAQGPYGIKFSGTDGGASGTVLFCVDMAFTITPPHPTAREEGQLTLGTALRPGRGGAVLGGAVLRDAMAELRAAFEAANAAPVETQ